MEVEITFIGKKITEPLGTSYAITIKKVIKGFTFAYQYEAAVKASKAAK